MFVYIHVGECLSIFHYCLQHSRIQTMPLNDASAQTSVSLHMYLYFLSIKFLKHQDSLGKDLFPLFDAIQSISEQLLISFEPKLN